MSGISSHVSPRGVVVLKASNAAHMVRLRDRRSPTARYRASFVTTPERSTVLKDMEMHAFTWLANNLIVSVIRARSLPQRVDHPRSTTKLGRFGFVEQQSIGHPARSPHGIGVPRSRTTYAASASPRTVAYPQTRTQISRVNHYE